MKAREAAKVQNTAAALTDTVRTIQSYGFIVVAGLIFGFDSDSADAYQKTLDGMLDSGLLSGDPSLLTALPGTPLYRRIEQSGRLRKVRYGLGGYKYQTNIKYLLPRETIIGGYRRFVRGYNDGAYQYARLAGYLANLQRGNFIALESRGYGDLPRFLRMVLRNRAASLQLLQRMWRFGKHPGRVYYACKGLGLALRHSRRFKGSLGYALFWLFAWSNSVLKYNVISDEDFDIESVDADFDRSQVLPAGYTKSADEDIPAGKIRAQQRYTVMALEKIAGQPAAATGSQASSIEKP